MNALTRFDTTALNQLNKALIGFDRLFTERAYTTNPTYPPYNIIKKGEDNYEIEVAVAGFTLDEIDVEVNQNQLVIRGQSLRDAGTEVEYLHRGLAYRDFDKVFTLAEHMQVGEATIKDGVLSIEITRIVPEALKPRKINVISIDKN